MLESRSRGLGLLKKIKERKPKNEARKVPIKENLTTFLKRQAEENAQREAAIMEELARASQPSQTSQ